MVDQTTEQRLAQAADELNERVATVHERHACPTCHAPVGARCRRALRQHTRRGVFPTGQPELKHSHRARIEREVPLR